MTVAKILQWPSRMMPLLDITRRVKTHGVVWANTIAHLLAEAGRLRVVEWDDNPQTGVYARVRVVPYDSSGFPGKYKSGLWINLRPAHFPGWDCVLPKPHSILTIEFLYVGNRKGRHRDDPTSYLEIKPR